MNTSGEKLFVAFCTKYRLSYTRIVENPNSKNPDYMLFPERDPIVIEIKDLTDNPDETRAVDQIEKMRFAVWGSSRIGSRIREKIRKSHAQLKAYRNRKLPTILLVFDDRDCRVSVLSPYEIAVAMYGYETRALNADRSVSRRFGLGAQMTAKTRKYISAIGVINSDLNLSLYLNCHAEIPLDSSEIMKCPAVTVYSLGQRPEIGFSDWTQLENNRIEK